MCFAFVCSANDGWDGMKTLSLPQAVIGLLRAAMRCFVAVPLLAFSAAPLLAQHAPLLPDEMVEHFCKALQVDHGEDFEAVAVVALRLHDANPHIHFAVTNSNVVNAFEFDLSIDASLICVPYGLVRAMGGSEGELAFILGHEIGHATDKRCKSLKGRFRVAPVATLLGSITGGGAGEQKACETRADELGFNLMTRAGYDPNDAAAALEALDRMGASPDEPLIFARLEAVGEDHPITPDRIRHIHKLIERAARTHPVAGTSRPAE